MNKNVIYTLRIFRLSAVCKCFSHISGKCSAAAACLRLAAVSVLLLCLFPAASAQYYDIGNEKPSVKWRKMRSKNFEIVYPGGRFTENDKFYESGIYKRLAEDYLKQVEAGYGIYADSVRYNYGLPKRFPMVLHTFNAESNGFTVWAPRQIDFFAQPPADLISSEPWVTALATHEGRHAWQIAHFNRGFFKVLSWFFGDQVIGAASAIYPSRWFLEGDAVVAETQMSKGGRGRSGFFLQRTLKGIVPENSSKASATYRLPGCSTEGSLYFYGKNRSWDRWRFGSVKAFSPNAYDVGYMINAMARHQSKDVDLSDKILNYEASHFLNANVVASAFRKHTGKNHRQYVKDGLLQEYLSLNTNHKMRLFLDSLHSELPAGGDSTSEFILESPLKRTGVGKGYYSEYKHIQAVGKDSVMAFVRGYGTPGYFVLVTKTAENGGWKEEVIRPFNYDVDPSSYNDGKLYWSEYTTDPRWSQHSVFSVCYIDFRTGVVDEHPGTEYERLPQFVKTEDSAQMFTVRYEIDSTGLCSVIHSTDAKDSSSPEFTENGQITSYVLNRFEATGTRYSSGIEAYYVLLDNNGTSLVRSRCGAAGTHPALHRDIIVPPSAHIITGLKMFGDEIYFITDMYGTPLLCRLNPSDRKIRLASLSTGISSYSIADDGSLFVVKDYGDRGQLPFKEKLVSVEIPEGFEFKYPLAEELSVQYKDKYGKLEKQYAKQTEGYHTDETYNKTANLFRLHSWAPVYAEFSGSTSGSYDEFYEEGKPGVTLYSQNTLGTMKAVAGYAYQKKNGFLNTSKHLHSAHASFAWSGWYPVIEGSAHFNDRIMYNKNKFSFRSSLAAYIPLTWEADGWEWGITPAAGWSFRNHQVILDTESKEPEASSEDSSVPYFAYTLSQIKRHQINLSLGAYKTHSVAKSQVYPRWGIGGRVRASVSPGGGKNFGSQYSAYVYGYIPGLTFNQGLRLSASYQRQEVNGKRFWMDNHIENPRGFEEDIYGRNIVRATADYAIPFYLGDISLGPIAYLQQLQVIPFFDYSRVDFLRPTDGLMGFYTGKHYQWESRYSFGADVMVRGHFLRIGFPMYVGVRYARTNKPDIGTLLPAAYNGKGNRDYVTLLLGVSFY